jgi:hypothetical protein
VFKLVGVKEQPVMNTGVASPWEGIKGSAGGSTPIHQLTGLDVPLRGSSACRSAGVTLPEGNTDAVQNDLAFAAPASGQQGDQGSFLNDSNLGFLHHGVGARFQISSGPQSHTLRGEGPVVDPREIFSGATSFNRSNPEFGTGCEVGSGFSDRGVSSILRDVSVRVDLLILVLCPLFPTMES